MLFGGDVCSYVESACNNVVYRVVKIVRWLDVNFFFLGGLVLKKFVIIVVRVAVLCGAFFLCCSV